ncbi:MAG: UDP-N-acetylmuramate dehydrogenase [Candidatus Cloacimonadaceae bacterium]|nr:UDP-N-acetylmuramate dehydrogenase [Candidatus Cloacimonadaceae bacterium]
MYPAIGEASISIQVKIINSFPELYELGWIIFDEPMSKHTSFEIGGPAEVFCYPQSLYQLAVLVNFAIQNQIPYLVIGKGSNLLISDKGLPGMVLSTQGLTGTKVYEGYIYAETGIELKSLCDIAMQAGLSGLEFACGIPGSLGGAVYMNAGAYNGEISQVLDKSICLVPAVIDSAFPLPIEQLHNTAHDFSYRHSALQDRSLIHYASVFQLKPDQPEAIAKRMADLDEQRSSKQPLDMPSAGSVFKRPTGHFTGKLIDDCGLRGYRIGGAMISDKHCGFIVNTGGATAHDVLSLIEYIQQTIWQRYQINLEPEIRLIGER